MLRGLLFELLDVELGEVDLVRAGRRDHASVAERPVRAAKAGASGAHGGTDEDESLKANEGGDGDALEAGHEGDWEYVTGVTRSPPILRFARR